MSPQKTMAHYGVTAKIGEGGMGAVYRALDTKLNREVAVKILPAHFAGSAERIARFTREAQVLASLDHAGIAAIFGVEDGALIMELVDGPTLADRLAKGMGLDEALAVARQIADALEHAHAKGVIHRDLKPANIKFTTAGRAKLLDFGLAKALAPQTTPESATITMQATMAGVVMGTLGYMSPEQAAGSPVDKRADIWAFGVVLYEMLAGRRPHPAAPDWKALPAAAPAPVVRLLRYCLEPDPAARLRDIGDARLILDEPVQAAESPPAARAGWVPWVLSVVLLGALSFFLFRAQPPAPAVAPVRFALTITNEGSSQNQSVNNAPSPDGSAIAMIGLDPKRGKRLIALRSLRSLAVRHLDQTEGANGLFWSPDGSSIGFFADGKLKCVSVASGAVKVLCESPGLGDGGAWGRNDTIFFNPGRGPLLSVPVSGGVATPVTALDEGTGELDHIFPSILPDGRLLYLARNRDKDKNALYVQKPGAGQPRRLLLKNRQRAVFAAPNRVLFTRDGVLFAQTVDLQSLRFEGAPARVADDVEEADGNGRSTFAASESGVLTYKRRQPFPNRQLAWYDRQGNRVKVIGPQRGYQYIALSPDEGNVAVTGLGDSERTNSLWLLNLRSGDIMRLTPGAHAQASLPVWSADAKSIAVHTEGKLSVVDVATGALRMLSADTNAAWAYDWSPDGRHIITTPGGGANPSLLSLEGEAKVTALFQTPVPARAFRFSPDGRWVAYFSNELGQDQVFIAAFPSMSLKRQISSNGGQHPAWRRDGKELYFLAPDSTLMAVDVRFGNGLEVSFPKPLFKTNISHGLMQYSPAADGRRFLMNDRLVDEPPTELTVILNWPAESNR